MKRIIIVLIAGILSLPIYVRAQSTTSSSTSGKSEQPNRNVRAGAEQTEKPKLDLPRFDLDFPGGTPEELVAVIEEASKKPVNVIIPEEHRNVRIPSLRMRGVNLPELFEAVGSASQKRVAYITGTYFGGINGQASSQYQFGTTSYGFRTSGQPRQDSIWYFYHETPPVPPDAKQQQQTDKGKTCRFFQLAPYLESYTIEDITTALETGWKMLGEKEAPKMSFHKDTKLLIAVGEPDELEMIDQLLLQLPKKGKEASAGAQNEPAPTKGGEVKKP